MIIQIRYCLRGTGGLSAPPENWDFSTFKISATLGNTGERETDEFPTFLGLIFGRNAVAGRDPWAKPD